MTSRASNANDNGSGPDICDVDELKSESEDVSDVEDLLTTQLEVSATQRRRGQLRITTTPSGTRPGRPYTQEEWDLFDQIIIENWGKEDFYPEKKDWWAQWTRLFVNRSDLALWHRYTHKPWFPDVRASLEETRGPQRPALGGAYGARRNRQRNPRQTNADSNHDSRSPGRQVSSSPTPPPKKERQWSEDPTKPGPSQLNRTEASGSREPLQPSVKLETDSYDADLISAEVSTARVPSVKGKERARPLQPTLEVTISSSRGPQTHSNPPIPSHRPSSSGHHAALTGGAAPSSSRSSTATKNSNKRPRDMDPGEAGPSKRATSGPSQLQVHSADPSIKPEPESDDDRPIYTRTEYRTPVSANTTVSTTAVNHTFTPSTSSQRSDARPLPTPSISPSPRIPPTTVRTTTGVARASTSTNGPTIISGLSDNEKALFAQMMVWWTPAVRANPPQGTEEELDDQYRDIWKAIAAEQGTKHTTF